MAKLNMGKGTQGRMVDRHSDYFEGTLQLRNPSKELITYVRNEVKKREGVWIAKEKDVTNGIDMYLSSQRFLVTLGNKIKKRFSGELKVTRKLFTRNKQTSRNVYRMSVMFRLYPFKKGDRIHLKEGMAEITQLTSKIHVRFLKDSRKKTYSFEKIKHLILP